MTDKIVRLDDLIADAAKIIAPVWPMHSFIARNPLQGLESLRFEEAVAIGEQFLTGKNDSGEDNVKSINRELIKWCQAFLDEGQAVISMPQREKGFYQAFAALAPFDKNLCSFQNKWVFSLPETTDEAIFFCLKKLGVLDNQTTRFIESQLAELPGFAGYIKWLVEWQGLSEVKNPITLKDFLAVRLVIASALQSPNKKFLNPQGPSLKESALKTFEELCIREQKYLQDLLKKVLPEAAKLVEEKKLSLRSDVQIAFCMDARSEPLRMRIERLGSYETFGCAGFFGLPISLHNYNTGKESKNCPVLLKACHEVFEEPISQDSKQICRHQKGFRFIGMLRAAWQELKDGFASSFAFVDALGLSYGLWTAIRTLAPVQSRNFKKKVREWISPALATFPRLEMPLMDQISYAESTLRAMGLTKNFSPLVVFCGHGSLTENNFYASCFNCAACGGNRGGANARILASILNAHEVRASLLERGIAIPSDTFFIGAEHNTATDDVMIEDVDPADHLHKKIVEQLKTDLKKAGAANSQHRCLAFGLKKSLKAAKRHVLRLCADWAETRPEWGLARNAAFIIGPRALTKDLDLEGRAFLHSYEWEEDEDEKSLEKILTASMVVAEWINTQYLFSTLNNLSYGSGSKISHNVTGRFGIMQGNGSDLRTGLPLQFVNSTDDDRYHEPLRLQVIVYGPPLKIDSIIQKHPHLKRLVFNGWVILLAIDPSDSSAYRLIQEGKWTPVP